MEEITRTDNMIHVGFAPLGGEMKYADVPNGTTIGEAMQKAGVASKEVDILLNDVPVSKDTVLENITNPVVTMIPRVEAGR